jgi:hypothetical protein
MYFVEKQNILLFDSSVYAFVYRIFPNFNTSIIYVVKSIFNLSAAAVTTVRYVRKDD